MNVILLIGNHYFLACIARRLNVMERTHVVHDVAQFLTKQDLKGKILDCDTRFAGVCFINNIILFADHLLYYSSTLFNNNNTNNNNNNCRL